MRTGVDTVDNSLCLPSRWPLPCSHFSFPPYYYHHHSTHPLHHKYCCCGSLNIRDRGFHRLAASHDTAFVFCNHRLIIFFFEAHERRATAGVCGGPEDIFNWKLILCWLSVQCPRWLSPCPEEADLVTDEVAWLINPLGAEAHFFVVYLWQVPMSRRD